MANCGIVRTVTCAPKISSALLVLKHSQTALSPAPPDGLGIAGVDDKVLEGCAVVLCLGPPWLPCLSLILSLTCFTLSLTFSSSFLMGSGSERLIVTVPPPTLRPSRGLRLAGDVCALELVGAARQPAVWARRSKGSCQVEAVGPIGETETPPDRIIYMVSLQKPLRKHCATRPMAAALS